ncbi:MAG: DNA polymerase III subunit gamma/tau [Alphaproteobacteria bacterium]|nr:DNA polymerase III subunit gamma/tau [Alphaproteobacteria bacterium]
MTAELDDKPGDPHDAAPDESPGEAPDGSPTIDDPNQSSFLDAPEPGHEPEAKTDTSPEPPKPAPEPATDDGEAYQVLARKYRPQNFSELIGQEALVRTLTNAFALDRVAHAFMLTGVRGVGKTTTARIIAKCLNASDGPTIDPDPADEQAVAISEDRHPDVIEVDAASRTGVNDIREILDGVRYRPVFGRYKVYIIDEVHMLSTQAFNALLKTLEEPPEHVKFIFATTEIRKVPVTVLSRCQRFDLRRVRADELIEHFAGIAKAEGADLEDGALRLIARAADGSVRDGLSLLDQTISAHCSNGATAREEDVRAMLGTADSAAVLDIFEAVMAGRTADALEGLGTLYDSGADPLSVLQDLLELSHWITRVKLVPKAADDPAVSELERTRGREMAEKLSVAVLSRAWQMLLKGVGEVQRAPSVLPATEMVLIRLAHAADMPPPAEILKKLEDGGGTASAGSVPPANGGGPPAGEPAPAQAQAVSNGGGQAAAAQPDAAPAPMPEQAARAEAETAVADPESFPALVALFATRREIQLRNHLHANVHLVSYEPGRLEFRPTGDAPKDLAGQVLNHLRNWCGNHWQVSVSGEPGAPTLAEQEHAAEAAAHRQAEENPVVRAALEAFPGARIERVVSRDNLTEDNLNDDLAGEDLPIDIEDDE